MPETYGGPELVSHWRCEYIIVSTIFVGVNYCNLFTREHLGVLMNSFKRVRAFQTELEFGSVGFLGKGQGKNLSEQGREPVTNSTHTWLRR